MFQELLTMQLIKKKMPFTSSIIEAAVGNIINARQKQTRKMQWT